MLNLILRGVWAGCAGVICLGMLLALAGNTDATPAPTPAPSLTPAFIIAEGSATAYAAPLDCRPGQPVDQYGWLFDTGVINLFTVYTFDGERAQSAHFTLTERIWQTPYEGAWVQLIGRCVTTRDLNAFDYEPVPAVHDAVAAASPAACAWVDANRTKFDFNAYKATQRFEHALASLYLTLDLNTASFRSAADVVFIDTEGLRAGIDCGRYVLGETIQRGDYLTLLAIIYLDERRLDRVIVLNTGFFLE